MNLILIQNLRDILFADLTKLEKVFLLFSRSIILPGTHVNFLFEETFYLRTFLLRHKLNKWKNPQLIIAQLSEIDTTSTLARLALPTESMHYDDEKYSGENVLPSESPRGKVREGEISLARVETGSWGPNSATLNESIVNTAIVQTGEHQTKAGAQMQRSKHQYIICLPLT